MKVLAAKPQGPREEMNLTSGCARSQLVALVGRECQAPDDASRVDSIVTKPDIEEPKGGFGGFGVAQERPRPHRVRKLIGTLVCGCERQRPRRRGRCVS